MYQNNILELLKWCNIDLLKFGKDNFSGYIYDDMSTINNGKALVWHRIEGFKMFESKEEYHNFKKFGGYHDDVNWIDACYDKETDCVIFGISCWYDCDEYQTICGIVPVKFLIENGISILKEFE